ncbi:Choline/ethanolaminephosphotransferase [Hysterangium stoloniferum]|nr:Choline/ethanolaminephosphotransferase [Hysterangium stoloniferum]
MIYPWEPLFQPSALNNLKFYRYSAIDRSPVTKYCVFCHNWDVAVKFFPMRMAPNLITLLGLIFILINVVTVAIFIPDLARPTSSWVYYSFALGLFLYQTFDNVDGRQARRTKSSSALGHIFDHTIDSLNTPLGGLIQVPCLGLGSSPMGLFMVLIGLLPMWLSTWEEYYTGTLYLGYINGPTEGILIACAVQITAGYNEGPQFWNSPFSSLISTPFISESARLIDVFTWFVIFAAVVLHTPACLYNVYVASRQKKTFTFRDAIIQHIPFVIYILLAVIWAMSPYSVIVNRPAAVRSSQTGGLIVFALLMTFTFGKLGPRVILARLTMSPFPWFNSGAFLPLIGGAILVNLPYLPNAKSLEYGYLWIATMVAMLDFIGWFTTLCQLFAKTLNINCLTLPKCSNKD